MCYRLSERNLIYLEIIVEGRTELTIAKILQKRDQLRKHIFANNLNKKISVDVNYQKIVRFLNSTDEFELIDFSHFKCVKPIKDVKQRVNHIIPQAIIDFSYDKPFN